MCYLHYMNIDHWMIINHYNNILVVVCCWQVSHLCIADVFAEDTHLEGVVKTEFTALGGNRV